MTGSGAGWGVWSIMAAVIALPDRGGKGGAMARDRGLEQQMAADLARHDALATVAMFGGLAWMWRGHLLCAAGAEGLLYRLGQGQDGWALAVPGVAPMMMGARRMQGWVRLSPAAAGDAALRAALTAAASRFVSGLPARPAQVGHKAD